MAIRSWTRRALAGAVVVVAVVSAVPHSRAKDPPPAALVNGEPIALAEVDAILNARPAMLAKATEKDRREMQLEALNMLVDDLLMQQFLRKNAPAVAASVVNKQITDLQAACQAQGQPWAEFLRANGQTEAQLRNSFVSMVQWKAYLDKHLTDAAVQKHFEAHRELFDQSTVRAAHILVRNKPSMTAQDRETAKAQIGTLRQEILAGKLDFAEAARKYSQDPTGPGGGDLGYFPRRGAVEENVAQAAFALKSGQVSGVVPGQTGWHLVMVMDRKAGPPVDFKSVEPKVREHAAQELLFGILTEQRRVGQVTISLPEVTPAPPTPPARRPFGSR
jgi:parvulin-like peptidyl-prolyl isomerase